MSHRAYCEHCDYDLSGLIETEGATVVCPECGKLAMGRRLQRRVRVALAVMVAIAPAPLGLLTLLFRHAVTRASGGSTVLMEPVAALVSLGALVLPPGAAWWLWRQSSRRRVDIFDVFCLVPVGWLLNLFGAIPAVAAAF